MILLAETRQADREKALSVADAKHREELATHQEQLLEANTKLTEQVERLTEEIRTLTGDIHRRIVEPSS